MKEDAPFDFPIESMIQYSYMADKFFLTFGVEEDEMFKAVKNLQIQKDPEVVAKLQENMKNLPPEVMMALTGQAVHGGAGEDHHDHSNCQHDHSHI